MAVSVKFSFFKTLFILFVLLAEWNQTIHILRSLLCLSREIKHCFDALNENPDCRVVVLSGAGKHFTAGLDLKDAVGFAQQMGEIDEPARKGHFMEKRLKQYQVRRTH